MNTVNKRLIIVASLVIFALANSFINGGYTTAETNNQLPTGLVSRWPADGDALDVVGSNHGTLLNGATFAAGKVGQAFSLDGVDDTVDLGPNNIVGSGNTPFTAAWWMYSTRIPTGFYYFTIRLRQDTQFFLGFNRDFIIPGDYAIATFRGASHQWTIPVDHSTIFNHWVHVAVIYNGGDKSAASSFELFLNGVQAPTGLHDLGGVGTNCGLNDNAIGSDTNVPCGGSDFAFFQGLIDEVQIYNRTLSSAEIQDIYNPGTDTTPPEITPNVTCDNPGNSPWCKGNITVSWTVTDPESPLTSTNGCDTTTLNSDTPPTGTTLTCTATSEGGTSSKDVTVFRDGTAPIVSCSVNPNSLWPPNHKLVTVTASVTVEDALSGPAEFTLVSVTSSEPDNGLGDGDKPNDIQEFDLNTPDTSGKLRAERSGAGNGRIYTLTYQGTDTAGNASPCAAIVTVPHNQGH